MRHAHDTTTALIAGWLVPRQARAVTRARPPARRARLLDNLTPPHWHTFCSIIRSKSARLMKQVLGCGCRRIARGPGQVDGAFDRVLQCRHRRSNRRISVTAPCAWKVGCFACQKIRCVLFAALALRGVHTYRLTSRNALGVRAVWASPGHGRARWLARNARMRSVATCSSPASPLQLLAARADERGPDRFPLEFTPAVHKSKHGACVQGRAKERDANKRRAQLS
jgi:hypothetical protein